MGDALPTSNSASTLHTAQDASLQTDYVHGVRKSTTKADLTSMSYSSIA